MGELVKDHPRRDVARLDGPDVDLAAVANGVVQTVVTVAPLCVVVAADGDGRQLQAGVREQRHHAICSGFLVGRHAAELHGRCDLGVGSGGLVREENSGGEGGDRCCEPEHVVHAGDRLKPA